MGYTKRGNACPLNILMHEQYPSNSLDQNNLAHVSRDMHYPSKFKKMCYGAQCILGYLIRGIVSVLCSFEH
jgi:hypothetical protein